VQHPTGLLLLLAMLQPASWATKQQPDLAPHPQPPPPQQQQETMQLQGLRARQPQVHRLMHP
jgi:hypothetical protein